MSFPVTIGVEVVVVVGVEVVVVVEVEVEVGVDMSKLIFKAESFECFCGEIGKPYCECKVAHAKTAQAIYEEYLEREGVVVGRRSGNCHGGIWSMSFLEGYHNEKALLINPQKIEPEKLKDLSGNGNDAEFVGNVKYSDDVPGKPEGDE